MSNLETEKRRLLNELNLQFKNLERYQQVDVDKLRFAKNLDSEMNITGAQELYIQKLKDNVEKHSIDISAIINRIKRINDGDEDDLIIDNLQKNRDGATKRSAIKKNKCVVVKTEEPKRVYDKSQASDYEMNKAYYFYRTKIESVENDPKYSDIRRELSYLPNNEGIIFNSIWFFGSRPDNGGNRKMTEKFKGYQIITEWNENMKIVVRKERDKPNVIISKKPRKNIVMKY